MRYNPLEKGKKESKYSPINKEDNAVSKRFSNFTLLLKEMKADKRRDSRPFHVYFLDLLFAKSEYNNYSYNYIM